MSDLKMTNGWSRVAFGDMVRLSRQRSTDPRKEGFERFVGLEHIEPQNLRIRRWGNISDGTTFTNVFRAGQVLFGKRRAYQRKVALAEFDGICSGDIFVLESKSAQLLPELLPFICQTDVFFNHAVRTSAGSLSPRTNWDSLATFEFELPPINEQQKFVIALKVVDRLSIVLDDLLLCHQQLVASSLERMLRQHETSSIKIGEVANRVTNGFVGRAAEHYVPNGVPYLRSLNIRRSGISFDDLVYISESFHKVAVKSQLRQGDLLTVQSGHVGETAVVPPQCENWNCHALILTRLNQDRALPNYVAMFLNSYLGQRSLSRLHVGTTVAHLNTSDLAQLEIPLPDVHRQAHIVDNVSVISNPGEQIQSRIEKLRLLRQRIMAVLSRTAGSHDVH